MNKKNLMIGFFIVSLFLLSTLSVSQSTANQLGFNEQANTLNIEQKTIAGLNTHNTSVKNIDWNITNYLQSDTYDWTASGWVFGPKPSYTMTYTNNSPITRFSSVYTGNGVKFTFTVPLDAITTGNGIGKATLNFNFNEFTVDATGNYETLYFANSEIGYDFMSSTWVNNGFYQNMTSGANGQFNLFTMNTVTRSVNYDAANRIYTISFEATVGGGFPTGRWNMNFQVMDSQGNWVDISNTDWEADFAPYRDLFFNKPWEPFVWDGYGEGYSYQLQTANGQRLSSLKRGSPALLVMNITADSLDKIVLETSLPYSYQQTVNKTETFIKDVVHPGGWIYNTTLKTYIWSPDPVTVKEEVTEQHEVQQEFWVDRSFDLGNGTWANEKLFVTYDATTNTWTQQIVAVNEYWDSNTNQMVQGIVSSRNVNSSSPIEDRLIFFNDVQFTDLGNGQWSGFFNVTADPAVRKGGSYWYDIQMTKLDGTNLWPFEWTSNSFDIEVQSAKIDVFDNNGKPVKNSFRVAQGESFQMIATLQGDPSGLDAGAILLEGWDGSWTDTSSTYTSVKLGVRYDWNRNEITVNGYNSTTRNILKTGLHWEWVEVQKTGWHWEWDNAIADYKWVNGTYTDWEYTEIDGDYWAYEYFDQQNGTWVEGWVSEFSDTNLIGGTENNTALLTVNDASVANINGLLQLKINVTVTASTPEMRYDFRARFEKREFREDFEAGWGPQISQVWLNQQVARVNTGSGDKYVEILENPLYILYNGTEHRIQEQPYIEVQQGKIELIRTFKDYDFWANEERSFFVNYEYDYLSGENNYYYQLLNGTKIGIEEGTGVTVYEIQLNTTIGGLNGTILHTLNKYAFHKNDYYWNGSNWVNDHYYTFFLVNGSKFVVSELGTTSWDGTFQNTEWWNSKTNENQWNVTQYFWKNSTTMLVSNPSYFVPLYTYNNGQFEVTDYVESQNRWADWEWQSDRYYIIDPSTGSRLYFMENASFSYSDNWLNQYQITVNGVTYYTSPWEVLAFYDLTYNGQVYSIPDNVEQHQITRQVFFVKGATDLILLPTSKNPAHDQWQLDHTLTSGQGVVPTLKFFTWKGEKVRIIRTSTNYVLKFINGTILGNVPFKDVRNDKYLPVLEGQDIWNATLDGFRVQYGTFSTTNYKFHANNSFIAQTAQDASGQYTRAFKRRNYDYYKNATDNTNTPVPLYYHESKFYYELSLNNGTAFNTSYLYSWTDGTYNYYTYADLSNNWYYDVAVALTLNPVINTYIFPGFQVVGQYGYLETFFDYNGLIVSSNEWSNLGLGGDSRWYYWMDVGGQWYALQDSYGIQFGFTPFWNFTYGNPDPLNYGVTPVGWFNGTKDQFGGFFHLDETYLVNASNNSQEIVLNEGRFAIIYEIQLNNGTKFNSTSAWADWNPMTNSYFLRDWHGNNYSIPGWSDFSVFREFHLLLRKNASGYLYFTLEGQNITSTSQWWFQNSNVPNLNINFWNFIMVNGEIFVIENPDRWTPALSLPINGGTYPVTVEWQPIKKLIHHQGYKWRYMYTSEWIKTISDVYEIVIGNPRSNIWGFKSWTTTDSGALDLDGDLTTTSDQYFVLHQWKSTDNYTLDEQFMNVDIMFDANDSIDSWGNEYYLNAFMGISTATWTWSWEENYIWVHASDYSLINQSELTSINNTVIDQTTGWANAGYWGIGWLLDNVTSAEIAAEAAANGWDWIGDNTFSTTWLSFGFGQDFNVRDTNNNLIHMNLQNSWSGLFLYNDTNGDGIAGFSETDSEVTHIFLPDSVGSVQFTTPGTAFNNTASSGSISLVKGDADFDTVVDFGVTFSQVNGTTYPLIKDPMGNYIDIWRWANGDIQGAELTSFKDRPTKVSIDEVSFQLHFDVNFVSTDEYRTELKLDQIVGNWDVNAIGGRKALEGYSLAITYFSFLTSSATYSIVDQTGTSVNNQQQTASNSFNFTTGGASVAEASLAGKYTWDKNKTLALNTTTFSAPLAQFQESFVSDNSGQSVGFDIKTEMFFLAIGFPEWDGYRVFQDPSFSAVSTAAGSTTSSGGANAPTITSSPVDTSVDAGQSVNLVWTATDDNPTTYEVRDSSGALVGSGSWTSGTPISVTVPIVEGANSFTVTFFDTDGQSASDTVTITGNKVTTPPPTGTGTTTTGPIDISTTEKPQSSLSGGGAPGFTSSTAIVLLFTAAIVVAFRRKKQ